MHSFKASRPDDIEFDLTVRMTLGQWRELRGQLPRQYPGGRLADQILEMISQAEKTYYPPYEPKVEQ